MGINAEGSQLGPEHLRCINEKTCTATQKNVKSHVFLDFEKTLKR